MPNNHFGYGLVDALAAVNSGTPDLIGTVGPGLHDQPEVPGRQRRHEHSGGSVLDPRPRSRHDPQLPPAGHRCRRDDGHRRDRRRDLGSDLRAGHVHVPVRSAHPARCTARSWSPAAGLRHLRRLRPTTTSASTTSAATSASATSASTSASTTSATTTATASATAATATTATASATDGALPRAEGGRTDARNGEDEDPQGALLRGSHPPRSLQASRPRHRPEPEARHGQAPRLPGQDGGRPALISSKTTVRRASAERGPSVFLATCSHDPRPIHSSPPS